MSFAEVYKGYIRAARKSTQFGYDVKTIAKLEPLLGFLFKTWWRVGIKGLERIPAEGPALLVGNTAGILPWSGLMLSYALMTRTSAPRRLNICCEMDWIEDERIHHLGRELGFVPYSTDHVRKLFEDGELVAVFPEGLPGAMKPFSERYRVRDFDWTRLLPAVENRVPVLPLATVGCDESFPIAFNLEDLARWLELPAFPVTPFMPWLPFPLNVLASFPVEWNMSVLRAQEYEKANSREEIYSSTMAVTREVEGEVQAELNRLLRQRIKAIF